MKKTIALLLSLLLLAALLTGCTGTPVIYYTECDCPDGAHTGTAAPAPAPAPSVGNSEPAGEGALKTGLAIITSVADSTSADGANAGTAAYDLTLVAVTVDDNGVIESCEIDGIKASVSFDASGAITSDPAAPILSKNELGDDYGMRKASSIGKEWNEQVAALAAYAEGKTVEELKNGAVSETGKAADADLASSATLYLGGFVSAIEAAVANAQPLGAQAGDTLHLAAVSSTAKSAAASADANGTAQLDCTVTAVTEKNGVITGCYIDAVQAKVSFTAAGIIEGDVSAPVQTKNQLGEAYGMKAYGNSKYEWNEQAASFAAYVTGKTLSEVQGIAVTETTAPADADLAATVTIKIGDFQALLEKALNG